jgi:hypothetical protein
MTRHFFYQRLILIFCNLGKYLRPASPDSESGSSSSLTDDSDNSQTDKDVSTDDVSDANQNQEPEVQPQCGVQNISTEQQPTPPWALRIIGKQCFTYII